MAIHGQRERERPQHSTSIYVTFKVFQLINQLRRRLKPRVQPSSAETLSTLVGAKHASLSAEDGAFRRLEKTLPLRSGHQAKHPHRNRVVKTPVRNRSSLKPLPLGKHASGGGASTHGEDVQRMLQELDGNFEGPNNALRLSQVAANGKLFLNRNTEPNFLAFPLEDLIRRLAEVHDALHVLYLARKQYDDKWLICQGNEIGLAIDEIFIANYEHLLLSLRGQLMQAIVRKVIELSKVGGKDEYGKKQRRLLAWFSEFPDSHRPLSTTWPWSIKPSLAVLWGVCWMFHYGQADQDPNQISSSGGLDSLYGLDANVGVSQNIFFNDEEANQFIGWRAPQPDEYLQFGRQMVMAPQQQQVGSAGGRGGVGEGARRLSGLAGSPLTNGGHVPRRASATAIGGHPGSVPTQPQLFAHLATDPIGSPGFFSHFGRPTRQSQASDAAQYNNTYALSSHASSTPSPAYSWPEIPGIATHDILGPQLASDAYNWNYQPTQQSPVSPQQRRGSHLTPTIRLTEPSGQVPGAGRLTAPQEYSSFNIYEAAPATPQAPIRDLNHQNISVNTNFHNSNPNYPSMGHIPQDRSPQNMTPNTTSILSPISMTRERSPGTYSRRPSNANSHASSHNQQQEQESEDGSQSPEDLESTISPPRGGHAFKRAEEPPRNAANKMVCRHKDCVNQSLTFDRKCEWSKHMDKHDRPYKCSVAGCEKLQGFTYSGGLLRHEREVHKMHGGTKKSLFCPYTDCKRSSGSGFTRKENLAEHIRRVHRRASGSSDAGNVFKNEAGEDVESPEELQDDEVQPEPEQVFGRKRKRSEVMPADLNDRDDSSDLSAEVKRLRKENEDFRRQSEEFRRQSEAKDTRLAQLEAAVMGLQKQQSLQR